MRKCFMLTAGLILLLLVIPVVFSAQIRGVEIEVETGYNNSFVEGSWVPVSVILKNTENEFEGELLVIYPGKGGKTEYTFKVILPPSSKKIYRTVIPPLNIEENAEDIDDQYLEVGLRSEKGNIKSKRIPLNEIDLKAANLLVTGKVEAGYNFINQEDEENQIFYLKPDKLPIHALSYRGISSIIIDEAELSRLDYFQQKALLNWLNSGGNIIFTGPVLDYSADSVFLQGLIPGSYRGKKYFNFEIDKLNYGKKFSESNHSKIMNFNFPSLELYDFQPEKGENLISYENIPVLWQKKGEGGSLRLLNFDPKKYQSGEWNNKGEFFDKLIQNEELAYIPEAVGVLEDYTDLMLNATVLQGPNKFIIILLILIYIALIYYSYSKLFQKKKWAGLKKAGVIIIITAIFSVFLYLTPGRELLTENNVYKEYAFIRKNSSSTLAYFESYNLFFTNEIKKTVISSERDKAIFSNFSRVKDSGFKRTVSPEISADSTFLEIDNNQNWVIEGFKSNFYEELPVYLETEVEDNILEIDLQNNSSYNISEIYIYYDGYWYQEKDFENKKIYSDTFDLKSGSSVTPWPKAESSNFNQNQEKRLKAQILQGLTELELGDTDSSFLICVLEGNNTQMKVDTDRVPVKKVFNGFLQIPLE